RTGGTPRTSACSRGTLPVRPPRHSRDCGQDCPLIAHYEGVPMTFRRTKPFHDWLLAAGVIAGLLAASDSRAGMINVAPGSILRPPAGTTAGGALVPAQDLVTDQYKNFGVLFGAPAWTVGAAVIDLGNGTQVWAPVSPGFNGRPYVNFGNSIVDSLVLPGSLIPAATNSLQVEFSNAQPHTALLTA